MRIVPTVRRLSEAAADLVGTLLRRNPSAVVGLPTGQTPLGLYRQLAALRHRGVDLSQMTAVCVDEYLGARPEDPVSLFGWLRRVALRPLGIEAAHCLRLPAEVSEPQLACVEFDKQLRRLGGFDMVILGLGWNGHVAFNEPGSPAAAMTRIVALQRGTIEHNRRYWRGRAIPPYAMTIGMRSILDAKTILLLVSGLQKARVLEAALEGPITPAVPASLLRRGRLTVLADRKAARYIKQARAKSPLGDMTIELHQGGAAVYRGKFSGR